MSIIALFSLIYEICYARNDVIWNFKVPMVNRVSQQVKLAVKNKVIHISIKDVNTQHPWIRNLFDFE